MLKILKSITRRKPIDVSSSETKLKRCLGIVDLTALGKMAINVNKLILF